MRQLTLFILMLFTISGICFADVVTSNLTINPTPCKRGDALHFTVTVYNNPNVPTAPGTAYYGSVLLDNTNHPELNPWSAELQTFKYPAPGKTVVMNFTSTYAVPQNMNGNTICFYAAEGQQKTNKISYKTCIQVKPIINLPAAKQKINK